jgi:hypothetical protein
MYASLKGCAKMLKGYINRWKEREKPEERQIVDYWFTSNAMKAACWETESEAENNCVIFDCHRIVIPSSKGGTHVCKDFKVEQRAPNEFVVFCVAPFILEVSGQGEKH